MALLEQTQLVEVAKNSGDVLSLTAVGTVLMGYLPPITAAVSLVWVCMRIYETHLNIREKKANARKEDRD